MQNKKVNHEIENNEFLKNCIENHTCYYFDGIIKLEDFDLDNILIDKKSHENILIYNISQKILIDSTPLLNRFNKTDISKLVKTKTNS